jgi:DNA-directed RNA polymerase subunit omega
MAKLGSNQPMNRADRMNALTKPTIRTTGVAKRSALDTTQLMRRAEDLVNAASNRYRITVQVANRAQRRRFEEFDSLDDPKMKPVIRAIIEMSDELTQPEIIGE